MSRNYRVEVEIYPLTTDEVQKATAALRGCNLEVREFGPVKSKLEDKDGDMVDTKGGQFLGEINLAGGIDEQSWHNEFVVTFPGKYLTSRWKLIDIDGWDHEFYYDPHDHDAEDY